MTTPKIDPQFPDRPQDPDFWKLSEIVNTLDDSASEVGWLETMKKFVPTDPRSLTYMARQRAKLLLKVTPPDEDVEDKLAIQWSDGFAAGVRYGLEVQQVVTEMVLDESIDGNRRQQSKRGFCGKCWEAAKGAANGAQLRNQDAIREIYDELRLRCPHQGR